MKKQPIFILTGAPASGKTSVSKSLLNRFPYGVHVSVDNLRGMVVSGLSNPIGSWDHETARQFRLARESAALIAKTYAQAGFAVAIDDVIFPPDVTYHFEDTLAKFKVYKVLLRPSLAVSKARNEARQIDIDNSLLAKVIEPIYDHFASFGLEEMKEAGWYIFDTSRHNVEETVSNIIARTECLSR